MKRIFLGTVSLLLASGICLTGCSRGGKTSDSADSGSLNIAAETEYDLVKNGQTEYRIVFLELHAVRRILFVLGGYIAGSAGHAGCLVFCALQYDLYAVTFRFLSHFACFFTVGIPSISFTLTGIVTL